MHLAPREALEWVCFSRAVASLCREGMVGSVMEPSVVHASSQLTERALQGHGEGWGNSFWPSLLKLCEGTIFTLLPLEKKLHFSKQIFLVAEDKRNFLALRGT